MCASDVSLSRAFKAFSEDVKALRWTYFLIFVVYSNTKWRFVFGFYLIIFIHIPRKSCLDLNKILRWFKCFCHGWTTFGLQTWPVSTSSNHCKALTSRLKWNTEWRKKRQRSSMQFCNDKAFTSLWSTSMDQCLRGRNMVNIPSPLTALLCQGKLSSDC